MQDETIDASAKKRTKMSKIRLKDKRGKNTMANNSRLIMSGLFIYKTIVP